MATYNTIDCLLDLNDTQMASARLFLTGSSSYYSFLEPKNNANTLFKWDGTQGSSYSFRSTSESSPYIVSVYDTLGNAVATTSQPDARYSWSDPYSATMSLDNFEAPYTGTYYVLPGWHTGTLNDVSISIDGDVRGTTSNHLPTGGVTISGSPAVGYALTVSFNLDDVDGMGTHIHGQWYADGVAIAGETNQTYKLTQADVGKSINVEVNYTDLLGTFENVASNAVIATLTKTGGVSTLWIF